MIGESNRVARSSPTTIISGSLESWLLLRSLRTFHLRLPRQSETATALVQWLQKIALTPAGQSFEGIPGGVLTKVFHSSLQGTDARGFDPRTQMTGGWNATFSIQVCFILYPFTTRHKLICLFSCRSRSMRCGSLIL
jgi:cystathionine beta-lyase/cystathionine gamma-synthase